VSLTAGSRLGPYEVVAPLGAGGMGEVYRARDARLQRDVAVKVLPAELSADAGRLKRLEKEARAASALNHPSIVAIYDVGFEGTTSYIVMELVAGRTLRELLLAGALPPRRLLPIAVQVAEGLAAAHDAGIVHRDLKPENVMTSRDGVTKILDFGLAKLESGIGSGEESLPTVSRTEPGGLLGTVSYMSPEQASGQPADFRSDQFSFGTILYETLTGRKAFHRETAVDTLASILHDEPESLTQAAPATPLPLVWVVERCLSKEPSGRYAATRDLAEDLKKIRDHVSTPGSGLPTASPRPAQRWRWAGAVLLAAGALAMAAYTGRRTDPSREAMRGVSIRRVTFQRGNVTAARFAPDGETVVYTAEWEGRPQDTFVTRIDGTDSRPLGITRARVLAVSRTGEIAFQFRRDEPPGLALGRVSMVGGALREVMENASHWADWSPDGRHLMVQRRVAGKDRIEYPIGTLFYESAGRIEFPRLSPDGERVALIEGSEGDAAICTVDRRGRKTVLVRESQGFTVFGELAWHPSGEIWFDGTQPATGDGLFAVSPTGRVRAVLKGVDIPILLDISRDGRLLVEREVFRKEIAVRQPGDASERDLSWLDQSDLRDLSRDGKTLLITELGPGGGTHYGVFLRRTDGSPAVRLGDGIAGSLSPDASWVLALRKEPGPRGWYHMERIPTGPGQNVTIPVGDLNVQEARALPPAGKQIFFWAFDPKNEEHGYVLDLDSGRPPRMWLPQKTRVTGFSSDGRSALVQQENGSWAIVSLEGQTIRAVSGIAEREQPCCWTADGRSLYVVRIGPNDESLEIERLDLATGQRTPWRTLSPSDRAGLFGVSSFHISADDNVYAYSVERVVADDLFVIAGLR
jgi:Tol biopolymer transport system component